MGPVGRNKTAASATAPTVVPRFLFTVCSPVRLDVTRDTTQKEQMKSILQCAAMGETSPTRFGPVGCCNNEETMSKDLKQ